MPDAATEKFLDDARAQAVGDLKGTVPDSMLTKPQPGMKISGSISTGQPGIPAAPAPLPPEAPGPEAQAVEDNTPPPTPAPTATPIDENTLGRAVKESAGQLGGEVGNGVMRAAAATARTLGFAAAGANILVRGDKNATESNDKIFDFLKNHVDTAYDFWKQDPNNTNAAASFVGNTVESVAPMLLGPAGAATMAANATVEKGKESVDAGDNTKTAVTLALINGLTTTAQLGVGFKDPNIAKRIAKWVGAGDILDEAGKGAEVLVRHILNDESYKQAIAKVDPGNITQLGINSVMQAIFGILHGPKGQKLVKAADPHGAAPSPDAAPVAPDMSVQPPPPPPLVPATAAAMPTPPAAAAPPVEPAKTPDGSRPGPPGMSQFNQVVDKNNPSPIADKPTAEPAADLRAQVADMKDPATARKAVYLSKENAANLGPDGIKALAGDAIVTKNFDRDGGVLISPNHSERSKATALRKANGDDMQRTLGQLTGAGDGKAPDQTHVIQGQTPEGAVASETAVAPHEVPAAVAAVAADGKTPVVTTPDATVARRAEEVAKENAAAPGPEAVAVEAPKEDLNPDKVQDTGPKEGDRRLVRVAGEDVPVVIAGSPDGNKVPVRMIDSEGRVAKDIRHVPLEMFKKVSEDTATGTGANEPVTAPKPEGDTEVSNAGSKPSEPVRPLEQAAKLYDQENTPPAGKKFAGSVAEHAARVAGLARAVAAHLKTATDVPDNVLAHAKAAADRAARLDLKTPEQLAKNQGVSHLSLDARAKDLKQAIHNLAHPDDAKIPVRVETKADALKAKLVKERTAAAEPAKPTMAEKIKAKQTEKSAVQDTKVKSAIKDIEDVTKPKKLNAGENAKISNAAHRYLEVGIDDAAAAHDNLERVVHEIYGPDRAKEATHIMEMARDQREDQEQARRPRRMSDTVDDEDFKGQHVDGEEHDDQANELKMSDADFKNTPMGKLHDKLQGTGFWKQFGTTRDDGRFLSTHKVLTHLVNVSNDNPVMQTILGKLLAHAPDLPIRPVDKVVHPSTGNVQGAATAGLFHAKSSSIQVRVHNAATELDRVPHSTTHALVHEIVHAATSYELYTRPNGEFAADIKPLLAVARSEAGPIGLNVHYGLHDEHEFVAEALTNPDFQKFLSEIKPTSVTQTKSLFARVADAITKMLGIKDPRARNLFQEVMSTVERGINDQARNLPESMHTARAPDFIRNMGKDVATRLADAGRVKPDDFMPGLDAALEESRINALEDTARALEEEPKPLQHDDEIKGVVGTAATETARLFRRAIRSGTVETIRRNVRGLTPYGGLVRSALRRGVFGHIDDPTNPLRNYDEQVIKRNEAIGKLAHSAEPIVNDRARLSTADNKKLGQFQIDSTMLGVDPEVSKADTPKSISGTKGFDSGYDELQRRWANLSDQQKDIYRRERDWNEKAMRQLRKASVDVALDSYSDKDIPTAQRQLLYSVSDRGDFEKLIGKGKMIDLADRNDKLIESLKDLSSTNEIEGPYFHLGRHGDYVVQVHPEGTKQFKLQTEAEAYAQKIRALSPNSKAKVAQVGGQWQVDYKAEHVSMHNSPAEAEAAIEKLRASGLDVGSATQKILSEKNASLSSGMENLMAGASSRLRRHGEDEASTAAIEALRQSFVAQMAARSAYAGSKLARRNVGGVKPEEMGRNFANHAQSIAWNTGHIGSVFKVGEALGQLREATKDRNQPQGRALQRGRVYDELTRRARQETQQAGSSQPANAVIAKLGFANYMTSLSHSIMYLTQNLTTTGPILAARFGLKGPRSLTSAMVMMSGPSFREAYRASVPWVKGHNADSIQSAIMAAVAKDKRFGKWARGANSPLQQLIDRGAIHTSLSNQLATKAKGGNEYVNRVMQYARIMPTMADMFNRVTTGLAALEMYNGDVYKAGDFIRETHMDYSNEDKPRAYRALNKFPGGNSVTMFKTYVTGMSHLLYSHFHDAAMGDSEGGRADGLKVIAGMMAGATLFAGVQRGAGIEPLRIMMYAYNRIAHPDRFYSFDNMTRRAVHSMVGDGKVADAINYGLPSAIGADMSSRMGLSDLMLHDPPDITSLDSQDGWRKLAFSTLGAGADELMTKYIQAQNAMESGRMDDWAKVVPFKFLNNMYDAWATGTKGKVTGSGAQITAPSVGAGVSHAIGFRTAEEAKISGKQRTDAEYKDFAQERTSMLISAYQKMDTQAAKQAFYQDKIKPWNDENPGHRVTFSELLKKQRSIQRTERTAQGFLGRDPVQNELNDY